MKVLLLADCNCIHTVRWAKALYEHSIDVVIFSLSDCEVNDYNDTGVRVFSASRSVDRTNVLKKISYLFATRRLKQLIDKEKPDILHAHYATSYGLLGALSRFQPYIISVWGTDVFDFPKKSFFHRHILKYNLNKASRVLSTSNAMAHETSQYVKNDIIITPFGVNLDHFKPKQVDSLFNKDDIVIGTIKTLETVYGIEYLIEAFRILKNDFPSLPLKLLIVGDGSQQIKYKNMVQELDLSSSTIITNKVPHDQVPLYLNMLSIYVALSKRESFGVAVIEASACCKPVVVSDVGGLPEVVQHQVTGFVVPTENPEAAAEAIKSLVEDKSLREAMGKNGRARVQKLYNWENNVLQMINIYRSIL